MLKPVPIPRPLEEHRSCLECNEPLQGRSDKKFCDDACRTAFNNRSKSEETGFVRNVNNILRRNRRILRYFHELGRSKITRSALEEMGFLFHFHTCRRTIGKEKYDFVYEYGVSQLATEEVLIVKEQFQS